MPQMPQTQNVMIVYAGEVRSTALKNVTSKTQLTPPPYCTLLIHSRSWITLIYLPERYIFETHGITGGAVFAARTRAVTGGTVVSYRTRVLTSCSDKPVLARAVTTATITWHCLVHDTLATGLAVFAISGNKWNYIKIFKIFLPLKRKMYFFTNICMQISNIFARKIRHSNSNQILLKWI